MPAGGTWVKCILDLAEGNIAPTPALSPYGGKLSRFRSRERAVAIWFLLPSSPFISPVVFLRVLGLVRRRGDNRGGSRNPPPPAWERSVGVDSGQQVWELACP